MLALLSPFVYGEVCLPLKRERSELKDISNFSKVEISPTGSHLLYVDKTDNIILFDVEAKEKTELSKLSPRLLEQFFTLEPPYGFSKDGSKAWTFQDQFHSIRIHNLITKESSTLSILQEENIPITTHTSEDRSQFYVLYLPKTLKKKLDNLQKEFENENLTYTASQKKKKDIYKQAFFYINIFDMKNIEIRKYSLEAHLLEKCSVFNTEMNMLFLTSEDGSLYGRSLDEKQSGPFFEFFPLIEGIKITSSTSSADQMMEGNNPINCIFLNSNTTLIKDEKKEQFILRRIKEQEEYILKHPELIPISIFDFSDKFYDPFIIMRDRRGTGAYHIPSEQAQFFKEHYTHIGKGGQFAIEGINLQSNSKKKRFKAIHRPFDLANKTPLLEWPVEEIKNISFNEDKSLFFIGSVFGDLFIINTETGHIKRSIFPHQFRDFKTSDSGNTFLLEVFERERVFSHQIYQIQEKCVQPMSSFSKSLENQFQKFIDFENPLEDSFLSFLTGVLQKEELVKENSKLILPLLWKIFLHSPMLYLDLHFRYASLKLLPPFPAIFINNENQLRVKEALRSIFETQILFRHSQLSHWDFVKNLEFALHVLTEEKQNFYIEKITESISNGATIRVDLFQDVFQSKIFYVIYSHVQSWFGRGYTPVSDITVARKKNSFLTLILSSEPIKNTDSIKTPFGIHYLVLENLSRDLLVSEFEAGKELVNDSVE